MVEAGTLQLDSEMVMVVGATLQLESEAVTVTVAVAALSRGMFVAEAESETLPVALSAPLEAWW